ncbi:MAG TPA: phosphatidate cytidylyltransferase [Euryarchaeota archaeon]|nr:phosphatidate cytidylyltransferase [Euryarchaeota archaeon]
MEAIIHDVLVGIPLLLWTVFVTFVLAKWFYKKYSNYRARKAIHYFAGGIVAIAAPFVFKTPYVIATASFLLFIMLYVPHARRRPLQWFQIEDKYGEVYFAFSYFVLFSIFWNIDVWVAVTSALFVAFGDGITGIIKEHYYGKRENERAVKGLNLGNLAMFLVCAPIGYALQGVPGLVAAVYASLIEAFYGVDDNVTIPLGSAAIIWLLKSAGV